MAKESINPGKTLDTKNITKIIDLMTESDLSEFEIEQEGLKLRICRGRGSHSPNATAFEANPHPTATAVVTPPPTATIPTEEVGVEYIKSPMVGTCYRSPSPDSRSFVDTGDKVHPNTVVCIIEAMKVMNEIHAETSGSIIDILVENGQTVEFGQPLFKIKLG